MPPNDAQAANTETPCGGQNPKIDNAGLRNQEIEEATNRLFIHRISTALIPLFIWLRVTPNFVSCLGAASGLAAAFFYYDYASPISCVAGFLLMIGWHIFDGADGQLARRTGQTSALGFVIDGICDYATYTFVYVALAISLSQTLGLGVWIIVISSGVCHALQAAAFEMQREYYLRWTTDAEYDRPIDQNVEESESATANVIARGYRLVQQAFRPLPIALERRLKEQNLSSDLRLGVQENYRSNFKKTVLAWSLLSANNRTIAIFLSCLAGQPLVYFLFEIIVLTLVMLSLIALNKRSIRAYEEQLGF